MNKKYYLIGFNGWVEVREALKEPTRVEGAFTKKIKEKQHVYIDNPPYVKFKDVESEYKIKNVAFIGGKVLNVISAGRCEYLLGIAPSQGVCRELESSRVTVLKQREII